MGFPKVMTILMEGEEDDLEFQALVRGLSFDMSAAEYVYFDADVPTSEPMINEHEVDWQERLQGDCINTITTKSNVSKKTQEISDDDVMKEEDNIPEEGVSFVESLPMFDKMTKFSFLDDESQMMSTLTRNFFKLRIKNKSR